MPAAPSADDRRRGSRSGVSRDPTPLRHGGTRSKVPRPPTPARHRWLVPLVFSLMAALVLGAGAVAAVRVSGPPPPPRLELGLPARLAVAPGPAPAIPLPATGSFDLVSTDRGQLAAVTPPSVLPIGSTAPVLDA